jgi:polyhydroxybutyrate depolymerase
MILKKANVGRIALIGILFGLSITACRLGSPRNVKSCPLGIRDETLVSGGQTRQYRIFIPPSYRPGKAVPLVLGFHGNGSNSAQFENYSGFSRLAAREGFLAVYPQGLGEPPAWDTWAGSQDVQFVRDLIATVESQWAIDPARVYAVGHSRGGGMANRLACDLADRVAAVGSVSGVYQSGEDCAPSRPVAIVAFHATGDPEVPYNGIGNAGALRAEHFTIGTPVPQWASDWAARDGCDPKPAEIFRQGLTTDQGWGNCRGGADVILYTINGGGHGWPGDVDAAQMIWNFFLKHPLSREDSDGP